MTATIDPALLGDHGRMVHMMPVPNLWLFWCPVCGRTLAFDAEQHHNRVVLRQGDLWAQHHGATVDWLRIGVLGMRPGDVT